MSSTQLLTPEGFRTAAYLEARARLDARGKRKNVSCNPPNVRCGNRCIPPNWDCRLKGQGTDSHLRAVKTDPLGGFANIERGTKRLVKGVVKGSPSDIHGGRQAIIRGTVKIAPGNIEQKKQLRAKLEQRTYAIGIGLLVVGGAFGVHNILMKSNTFGYRNTVGRNINDSVRSGVNQVLDAVPILGAQRRRTRAAVAGASAEAAYRSAFNRAAGPETLRETLGRGGEQAIPRTPLTDTLLEGHSNLRKAVGRVDRDFRTSTDIYEWDKQHRSAFWGATLRAGDLGTANREISVFARPSAEEYLARQFGVTDPSTTSALKLGIQQRIAEERLNLISLAKQRGYRTLGGRSSREYIHGDDFQAFVRDVVGAAGITSTPIRQGLEDHVVSVLREAPSTYTNRLYRNSVIGFHEFYQSVGNTFVEPTTPGFQNRLSNSTQSIQQQADLLRTSFLARQINRSPDIAGPSHAELIRRAYFATRVRGTARSTYSVTGNAAISTVRELTGRNDIIGPNEAYQILRDQFGFTGIVPPSARRDAISPEAVRARSYTQTKQQLADKGKPCGESFIPKNHKCGKANVVKTAAKVALAAGAVAGTVYALKKAKVGEFHTGIATGDVGAPVRKRRFSYMEKNQPAMESDQIADLFTSLKTEKGVVPENVDALQSFIKAKKLRNDPKNFVADLENAVSGESRISDTEKKMLIKQLKLMNTLGVVDGMASQYSNNVYIRNSRKDVTKLQIDTADVTKAVGTFMDRRGSDQNPTVEPTEYYKRLFTISRNTANGDTTEYLTAIHEISHAAHFEASRKNGRSNYDMSLGNMFQPRSIKSGGVTVSNLDLRDALRRAASEYGRSDLDGRRAETFAELSVLYITQGKRFKNDHPIAYDWVDQIWKAANA